MTSRTILNDSHRALGAKMVDFGGWDMPIHYGSQIEEHHLVRRDAGMFDVSHMTVVDLRGGQVRPFLRQLVANSVDKLHKPGKALYTCMLDAQGGVIDDLIVYYLSEDWFRLVVNAATRDKDLAWIAAQAAPFGVEVTERPELAMIAVQGPAARERMLGLLSGADAAVAGKLGKFAAAELPGTRFGDLFVARTGTSRPRMSTRTPCDTSPAGTRAKAIALPSVGEKVPDRISPSPLAVSTFWPWRSTPFSSITRPIIWRASPAAFCASSTGRPMKSRPSSRLTVHASAASNGLTASSMSWP